MAENGGAKGPLQGVRVMEFGQIAAGPFAGSLLADLGADVVKIERPDGGDGMRSWPPLTGSPDGTEYSENFASLNRNKRSIAADLKQPCEVARLCDLAAVADVVVENFRPGVLKRLGLGYDDLSARNPRLVYCSISGYGQVGPQKRQGRFRRHRAGHERADERDRGTRPSAGQMRRSGRRFLRRALCRLCHHGRPDASPQDGAGRPYRLLDAGRPPRRRRTPDERVFRNRQGPGGPRLGASAQRPYQAYLASDEHFVVAAGNDRLWGEVCEAVGLPELRRDERFAGQSLRATNQAALAALLEPRFRHRTAAEWLRELDRRGVPCAPINSYPEILDDPQVAHLELVRDLTLPNGARTRTTAFPVAMSDYRFEVYRQPPELGADNADVFAEWLGAPVAPASEGR